MRRREFLKLSVGSAAVAAVSRQVPDRFVRLGLIPKPVVVRDAVWKPVQS